MQDKVIIVVSSYIDATIRETQPDVDFRLFRNLQELADFTEVNAIRAQLLFFTEDTIDGRNTSIEFFKSTCYGNSYLTIDKVIYITTENAPEIPSMRFIIEENNIDDHVKEQC